MNVTLLLEGNPSDCIAKQDGCFPLTYLVLQTPRQPFIMNISSRIHVPWEDGKYASSLPLIASLPSNALPYAVMAFLFLAVVLSIHHSTSRGKFDNTDKFPLFNPKSPWEFSSKRTKQEYHMNSTANMLEGVKKFGDNPYRILSFEHPEALVLPARYAEEIKDDARLSFAHVLNMVCIP